MFNKFPSRQSGSIMVAALGSIVVIAALGFSIYGLVSGPIKSAAIVTMRSKAQADLVILSRLIIKEAADPDVDSTPETPAFDPSVTPRITSNGSTPSGGGVPGIIGGSKRDSWNTPYAYCAWDHGTTNSGTNMLSGEVSNFNTKLLLAVVSAGPDRQFQTRCGNSPDYLTEDTASDDIIDRYTFEQAAATGLWQQYGSTDKIMYDAGKVLVGNVVGTAEFQVDGDAEIGGNLDVGGSPAFVTSTAFALNAVDFNGSTIIAPELDLGGGDIAASSGVHANSLAFAGATTKTTNLKANLLDGQPADYYLDPVSILNPPAQYDPDNIIAFDEPIADDITFARTGLTTMSATAIRLNGVAVAANLTSAGNYDLIGTDGTVWGPTSTHWGGMGDCASNSYDLATPWLSQDSTVCRIQNRRVDATLPTVNQVLGWDGTTWKPMSLIYGTGDANTVALTAGGVNFLATNTNITAANCPSGSVAKYNGTTWQCRVDFGTGYSLPMDSDALSSSKRLVNQNTNANWLVRFNLPTAATDNDTIMGELAGLSVNSTTGTGSNVMIGYMAGRTVVTGGQNTLIGNQVGYAWGGDGMTGITAVGNGAAGGITTTSVNAIAIGYHAAGGGIHTNSIAIGNNSLRATVDENANVAIGAQSGFNYPKQANTLIGAGAGYGMDNAANSGGTNNTFIGQASGGNLRDVINSTIIGASTYSATSCGVNNGASYNVVIGKGAVTRSGPPCSTGTRNVVLGTNAAGNLTTGERNVLSGYNVAPSMTSGSRNVMIGESMGISTTNTADTVSMGYLNSRGTAGFQRAIAIGTQVHWNGSPNITDNVAIGSNNLTASGTVARSVALGTTSCYRCLTPVDDVMLGTGAGYRMTGGDENVLIGNFSGVSSIDTVNDYPVTPNPVAAFNSSGISVSLTDGAGNIVIGRGIGVSSATGNNYFVIGSSRVGRYLYGSLATGNWTVTSLTDPSDKRLKRDIRPLRDVVGDVRSKLATLRGIMFKWKRWFKVDNREYFGFKAQDVQKVFPWLVLPLPDSSNMKGYLGVTYDRMVPILIQDMKERQERIDALKAELKKIKENK